MSPRNLCLLLTAALLASAQPSFALDYSLTNIGGLDTTGAAAYAVNNAGQVTGYSYSYTAAPVGPPHAFRTNTTGIINPATDDQGTNGAYVSYSNAINASGQIAGYTDDGSLNQNRAFRVDPNAAMLDLGTLGGATACARGINNSGQVVGVSSNGTYAHAFRTQPNAAINPATDDLGALGNSSEAYAINTSAQVVGNSNPLTGPTHAFRTSAAGLIDSSADLGTLYAGYGSYALAINDAGNAVGKGVYTDGFPHAFYVPAGRALLSSDDLGMLPNAFASTALAINNSNVIVGASFAGGHDTRAVLWTAPGTAPIDLNSFLPANSGWTLEYATGINDTGVITGYGEYTGTPGGYSAFLLTPIPEPATAALLLAAAPLLLRKRRPHNCTH